MANHNSLDRFMKCLRPIKWGKNVLKYYKNYTFKIIKKNKNLQIIKKILWKFWWSVFISSAIRFKLLKVKKFSKKFKRAIKAIKQFLSRKFCAWNIYWKQAIVGVSGCYLKPSVEWSFIRRIPLYQNLASPLSQKS